MGMIAGEAPCSELHQVAWSLLTPSFPADALGQAGRLDGSRRKSLLSTLFSQAILVHFFVGKRMRQKRLGDQSSARVKGQCEAFLGGAHSFCDVESDANPRELT